MCKRKLVVLCLTFLSATVSLADEPDLPFVIEVTDDATSIFAWSESQIGVLRPNSHVIEIHSIDQQIPSWSVTFDQFEGTSSQIFPDLVQVHKGQVYWLSRRGVIGVFSTKGSLLRSTRIDGNPFWFNVENSGLIQVLTAIGGEEPRADLISIPADGREGTVRPGWLAANSNSARVAQYFFFSRPIRVAIASSFPFFSEAGGPSEPLYPCADAPERYDFLVENTTDGGLCNSDRPECRDRSHGGDFSL